MRVRPLPPRPALALPLAALSALTACATLPSDGVDTQPDARVESLLTLPLREGASGFDRMDRALQMRFSSDGRSPKAANIYTQKPVTLGDGYVVQRYLRLEDGRHALLELSSSPCFSIERAIALAPTDPVYMEHYRNGGSYIATGSGMSVGVSSDGPSGKCVIALEIANTPP